MTTNAESADAGGRVVRNPPRCTVEYCAEPAARRWDWPAWMAIEDPVMAEDGIALCGAHWEELADSVRTAGRVQS